MSVLKLILYKSKTVMYLQVFLFNPQRFSHDFAHVPCKADFHPLIHLMSLYVWISANLSFLISPQSRMMFLGVVVFDILLIILLKVLHFLGKQAQLCSIISFDNLVTS